MQTVIDPRKNTIKNITFTVEKSKILLVEGDDDYHFFKNFLEKLNVTNIHVLPYDSKDRLDEVIQTLPKRPDISKVTSIAITRDTDNDNPQVLLNKINRCLVKAKFASVEDFVEFSDSIPKTGIYIFPDCKNGGELEDLLLSSINDANLNCVNEFFDCTNKIQKRSKPAKSKLYAWLSSQNPPIQLLGRAVQSNLFKIDHPVFEKLKRFINNLSQS